MPRQHRSNIPATVKKPEETPAEEAADPDKLAMLRRRAELIGDLLQDCDYKDAMFRDAPPFAPENAGGDESEGTSRLASGSWRRPRPRKGRQAGRFFQLSASGVRLGLDSFAEAPEHRLTSRMDLTVSDLFLAETISEGRPVKMFGEWFNERRHPRDSNDGLLMLRMVSMRPVRRLSKDGKRFMNDESRVTMELLPLRMIIYQKGLRFVRGFFARDDTEALDKGEKPESDNPIEVTPTFLQVFKMLQAKLKVDYRPENMDAAALKDGSYVELINLLPLEEMVLTLQPFELNNITGWGSAFSEVTRCWIQDICATQMHKFLTSSSPLHPITNVSEGVADLVMIPLDELKEGGSFVRGLRDGTTTFAGTLAYETLNTTAKATKFAADRLSGNSSVTKSSLSSSSSVPIVSLPPRPSEVPYKVGEVARHALDSVSRGLEEAGYKIVIVPYREYRRSGTAGAVKSVVRGIPVAVRAPLSGASEAVSYASLMARNRLRPEKRKEEEATLKGLSSNF